MQRICILGCSGGGKTTLANVLGERFGIPVIHLDVLFWKPGWVESDFNEFRGKVADAAKADRWIIDGNFPATFDLRLPRADMIIWIEQPRLTCLWRAVWRATTQFGTNRPDLALGCPEKYDLEFYKYIWNFRRDNVPRLEQGIAQYAPHTKLFRLNSDEEIAEFLRSV